jgi:fumarate hydratase subunit alpha
MREFDLTLLRDAVYEMAYSGCYILPEDIVTALKDAKRHEDGLLAKETLNILLDNLELSSERKIPACQDTGLVVVWLDVGRDVHFSSDPYAAIQEGVRDAYRDAFLRMSVVTDPLRRINSGDNTPALITTRITEGDKVTVTLAQKGFGSENVSRLEMLKPTEGLAGVRKFVLETVDLAGPNACPPLIVGVGVGGTFDHVAMAAKRALMRPVGSIHPDPFYAGLEKDWLDAVNDLGYGPQGYGGRTTALAVFIEALPTHIAGLPVAVNLNCHMARHESRVL